jgi:hypothetical protein
VDSRTPEEAVVITSLRCRLAKQAEEFAKAAARGPGINRAKTGEHGDHDADQRPVA